MSSQFPFCIGHVLHWTMSVTLVLCLMVVLRILSFSLSFGFSFSSKRHRSARKGQYALRPVSQQSPQGYPFSLTLSILLSIARWLVSSFFTNAFVRDHVWHSYVIAGKTHWLKTFLFRLIGRCLFRKISLYFPKTLHPTYILIKPSCCAVLFVPDIYS